MDLSKSAYIENHFSSDWFAQEYISGTKYVIDVFANEMGKPQLIIPRKVFETQSASAFRSQTINNNVNIFIQNLLFRDYRILNSLKMKTVITL